MNDKVPLYVIGLSKDEEPAANLLRSKFGDTLDKAQKILSDIIEAKIDAKTQNSEGSRTHYDATATVVTSKNRLRYTESGWDILKIVDDLSKKLEGDLTKHDQNRQKKSIRKKESF